MAVPPSLAGQNAAQSLRDLLLGHEYPISQRRPRNCHLPHYAGISRSNFMAAYIPWSPLNKKLENTVTQLGICITVRSNAIKCSFLLHCLFDLFLNLRPMRQPWACCRFTIMLMKNTAMEPDYILKDISIISLFRIYTSKPNNYFDWLSQNVTTGPFKRKILLLDSLRLYTCKHMILKMWQICVYFCVPTYEHQTTSGSSKEIKTG